ncbi:molybdate ABC transporter substrate-binding protein [Neiella marina]|uniref:Molybdate ABC transporter substrate-binding protein n=2 Tax=Neiella holothuriorum TaxID=2870530 RepID=A0ABS7EIM3_9GAMM|nr:molybdate ABC transporter substrate-binding protein [Neiella holothuriorum]
MLFNATARAADLQVAVAANFYRPMQQLAANFETKTGHHVGLSAGSTGKLFAQISNGAPFDVFIAADQTRPNALVKSGLAQAESQFTVAQGQLALWSNDPSLINGTPAVLQAQQLTKLAIASPKTAPYGAAAVQVLQHLKLYPAWQPKLIQGQNISHTYQYVSSGNVDAGFVAVSQIYHQGSLASGSAWIVPSDYHQPLNLDAVLLTRTTREKAAQDLLRYLASDEAKALIRSFGYQIID